MSYGADRLMRTGGLVLAAGLLSVQAQIEVTLEQSSSPPGVFITESSTETTGEEVRTLTAPSTASGLTFLHWEINGDRNQDAAHIPRNPAVFTILEATDAVAVYIDAAVDSDADGFSDWWELQNYTSLVHDAASDTDGDGFSLREEYQRHLGPGITNLIQYGSLSERGSAQLSVIVDPSYYRFHERSEPYDLWLSRSRTVSNGLFATTAEAALVTLGMTLVEWQFNGQRMQTAEGVAIEVPGTVVTQDVSAVAYYVPSSADIDADGLPDWYELRYHGRLDIAHTNDADGDGYSLAEEYQRHQSDAITNVPVTHTISSRHVGFAVDWGFAPPPVDFDDIPDEWEHMYYGSISNGLNSDTDLDGVTLYHEYQRHLAPTITNTAIAAPLAERSSPRLSLNLSGWPRYAFGYQPPDLFDAQSDAAAPGSVIRSRVHFGDTLGFSFVHWVQDGARVSDAFGVSMGGLVFEAQHDTEATAHFIPTQQDDDADGLPDWWELFSMGSITNAFHDDRDQDGVSLYDEYQRHLNPSVPSETVTGVISERSSEAISLNLQFFDYGREVLVDGLPQALFSTPDSAGSLAQSGNTAPALGDWDGDSDLDLFLGASNAVMQIFENQGSPLVVNFVSKEAEFSRWAAALKTRPSPHPALGDFTGDGQADLAVGGEGGDILLMRSSGHFGSQTVETPITLSVGGPRVLPTFGDVTGDGLLDLLVLKADGTIDAYANTGVPASPFGSVASLSNLLGVAVLDATGLTVADVNRDGKTDILVSDRVGSIWRFDQTSSPATYAVQSKVFAGSYFGFANRLTLAVSDLDGDGDEDVVAGNHEGTLLYLRDPDPKLTVVPPARTLLVGERQPFSVQEERTGLLWSLYVNSSQGSINPTNGLYTAGTNASVVDVIEVSDGHTIGRGYANVLGEDDITLAGKAVIIAGGKSFDDPVWLATDHVSDFAYNTLLYRGFSRANVNYLSFDPDQDADENGLLDDIDGFSSLANASDVFTNWVAPAERLFVYFANHGSDAAGQGFFRLNSSEIVPATLVSDWLDNLQDANTNLAVTVVLDFCYAGSFVDELMYTGTAQRIVIASTESGELTYFIAGGQISFSDVLFSALYQSFNLERAFNLARQAMLAYQHATMDDNQDGLFTGADGPIAATVTPGASFVIGRDVPVIGTVTPNLSITGATATVWSGEVTSVYPVDRVWCSILAPSHRPDASVGIPVVDVPEVELLFNPASQRYEATLSGFTESGTYQVNYNASDIWGGVSFPKRSVIFQGGFDERLILAVGQGMTSGSTAAHQYMGDLVYNTFRVRNVAPDRIYYLSDGPSRDLDGTGTNAVDATISLGHLAFAVTNWAAPADKITVYLIGDGSNNALRVANNDLLTPPVLDGWLDALQQNDVDVTCVMDFDRSGGFISTNTLPPMDRERVQIASSRQYRASLESAGGTVSFTQYFMTQIFGGKTVGDAYNRARKTIRRASGRVRQRAELDDNANADANEKNVEGRVARMRYFGSAFVTGDDAPLIGSVISPAFASASNVLIWARDVIDVNGISNVWCIVTPPEYDGTSTLQRVDMSFDVPQNRYQALLTGLDQPGSYALTFYANDTLGVQSDPVQSEITRVDAYEIDNTHAEASLYLGPPQFHSFHTSNDVDWIRFYAVSEFVYDIETFHFSTNIDTVVEVFREEPSGALTPIDRVDDFGFDEGELTGLDFPADGWYAVKVSQFTEHGWGPGTYDLIVSIPVGAGGHLIVLGVDLFNGVAAPPGLTAAVSGRSTGQQSFGGGNNVLFQNLPSGGYSVQVPAVSGYDPERDPDVPGQIKNPESVLFGNPRNLAVGDDEWNTLIFAFLPVVHADGIVRDAFTGEPVDGAQLRFTARSGVLDGDTYDHYPVTANYGDLWVTGTDGRFPTNVILPRLDWDVHLDHTIYSNETYRSMIREASDIVVTNLGSLALMPPDENSNGVADAWEALHFPLGGFDPMRDTDDDGVTDREEFYAGTAHTNVLDALKLFIWGQSASGAVDEISVTMAWFQKPWRAYVIETKDRLDDVAWRRYYGPVSTNTTQPIFLNPFRGPVFPEGFYRLRIVQP